MTTVWKVVRVGRRGVFRSYAAPLPLARTYRVGETYHWGTPALCFKTKRHIREWMGDTSKSRCVAILRCRTSNAIPIVRLARLTDLMRPTDYWADTVAWHCAGNLGLPAPEGTVACWDLAVVSVVGRGARNG